MENIRNRSFELKNFRRKILKDDFLRHAGVTFISSNLAGALNLVFYMVIIRMMTVEEYGVFISLVALIMYFGQASSAFQPVLARFLAVEIVRRRPREALLVFKRVARDLGLISLGILAGFVAFARPLAAWQQIYDRPALFGLVGVIVAVYLVVFLPNAFFQGAQLFNQLALVTVVTGVMKFIVGVGLVAAGLGAAGALGSFLFSALLLIAAGIWFSRSFYRRQPPDAEGGPTPRVGDIYRYVIPASLALLAFAVLTNIDITLVKSLFTPREAGYYSSAQLVGRIILYLATPLAVVVLPKAAGLQELEVSSIHLLNRGLKLGLLLCGSASAVCWAAPATVSRLIIGSSEPAIVSLIGPFSLAMALYSLLWVVVFYNLSVRATAFIKYLAVTAAVQASAIYLFHPSLTAVLIIFNICAAASLITTLLATPAFPMSLKMLCNSSDKCH